MGEQRRANYCGAQRKEEWSEPLQVLARARVKSSWIESPAAPSADRGELT